MSNRSSYEGETRRLPHYSAPPENLSLAGSEDALPAYAPPSQEQPRANTTHGGRKTGQLIGLVAIAIGVALFANSGRLPISGGFIERTSTIAESYTAEKLAIDVGNGDVTLSRATGAQIEVEAISHGYGWTPGAAEQAAARITPDISVAGGTLHIEQDQFDSLNLLGRWPYVEYRIALPENVDASVSTGSGDLETVDIAGALELSTGSGDVRITNAGGELVLDTGSGDIEVEGLRGRLSADTGSGNIEIDAADGATVQLQTGSGNVEFAGSLRADGDNRIDTGSGNIELELPEDASLELSARTGSGDIDIDDRWDAEIGANSANARLGSGGTELELHTSSGNISVEAE